MMRRAMAGLAGLIVWAMILVVTALAGWAAVSDTMERHDG